MRPLLFTSIPPRQRGAGFAAPQLATIRSWLDAGFQPVSIHLAIEIARHPGLRDALRVAAVDCVVLEIDAGDSDSALLCPIVDMLQAIRRRADESPCGIINADIRIAAARSAMAKGYRFQTIVIRKDHVESGRFRGYADLKGMKIALPDPAQLPPCDADVIKAWQASAKTLAGLGAIVETVHFPSGYFDLGASAGSILPRPPSPIR